MIAENPVSRLHEILLKAKNIESASNAISGWATVFNLQITNKDSFQIELEVFNCLIQLHKLIDEVEQLLRENEKTQNEGYLNLLSNVQRSIRVGAASGLNLLPGVNNSELMVLELLAEKITPSNPEPVIEEEQLKGLLVELNGLYEEVAGSLLNEDLKKLILDQLEIIRRAIHEYRIRGITRLREALGESIGNLVLNSELLKQNSDKEEVNRFSKFFSKFASFVSFAANITKLVEAGGKYLPFLISGGGQHN